ncbi:2-C-methyl-D-erythritol 4-phosphate cytidylyltransferase / 2-C-methyl-D-erythritol 2,4-cyclodiphosphate synthase [hydrothermal vent metagenome]|uniref:2-C-methyl-D-erythritol 4-phosphate cytidylyltransferase / 2-C-methyl-D-erythritol 2,4-cyclodiphosphate synthase n=1 Tax=hydrothermal vent metagenome TaxID=652676 RepID=A0A3B0SRB1_9ZZZZ
MLSDCPARKRCPMSESIRPTKTTHAIVLGAGSGKRAGLGRPKQFESVLGNPMIRYSVEAFLSHPNIDRLWVVIAKGQEQLLSDALEGLHPFDYVEGGTTRQQSVFNGLKAIRDSGGTHSVLIHDAARPFLTHQVIDRLLDSLSDNPSAIPVIPTIDTTIKVNDGLMQDVVDRSALWRVQTPQAFRFEKLFSAHESWAAEKEATDDAQIMRGSGHDVAIVEGDERLKKFTTAQDFHGASKTMNQVRTGMGFDVHQLSSGEELWIGGVKIDHEKGLAGHSDADVLLHALTDALLGTIGAGDIGDHFPPDNPQWRGTPSRKFVEYAASLIKQKGGIINNVDMTIICEAPKIKPYRKEICENISIMLDLLPDRVSVKATTTEGLGFTGRREGIAAQAIATISME